MAGDFHEHDVVCEQGIWRKGELVFAKRVGRSLIARARQRAGQALELARRILPLLNSAVLLSLLSLARL